MQSITLTIFKMSITGQGLSSDPYRDYLLFIITLKGKMLFFLLCSLANSSSEEFNLPNVTTVA